MARKSVKRNQKINTRDNSEAPIQGMNPVSPSQDYRRKAQQQQNASYVPASYGAASQYSRNNVNYHTKSKGSSKGAKIVVAIIFIALIATVAGLGFYVYKQWNKVSSMFRMWPDRNGNNRIKGNRKIVFCLSC